MLIKIGYIRKIHRKYNGRSNSILYKIANHLLCRTLNDNLKRYTKFFFVEQKVRC